MRAHNTVPIFAAGLGVAMILSVGACAPVGMTLFGVGSGITAGTTVDHNLSGINYKTFTASLEDVKGASREALFVMGIQIADEKVEKEIHLIQAKTENRDIEIELEPLSDKSTRMRVVASQNIFFLKDKATASEIITQTAFAMDRMMQARILNEEKKAAENEKKAGAKKKVSSNSKNRNADKEAVSKAAASIKAPAS